MAYDIEIAIIHQDSETGEARLGPLATATWPGRCSNYWTIDSVGDELASTPDLCQEFYDQLSPSERAAIADACAEDRSRVVLERHR